MCECRSVKWFQGKNDDNNGDGNGDDNDMMIFFGIRKIIFFSHRDEWECLLKCKYGKRHRNKQSVGQRKFLWRWAMLSNQIYIKHSPTKLDVSKESAHVCVWCVVGNDCIQIQQIRHKIIQNKHITYLFQWQCFGRFDFSMTWYLFLTAFVSVFPQMYTANRRKVEIRLLRHEQEMQRHKRWILNENKREILVIIIIIIWKGNTEILTSNPSHHQDRNAKTNTPNTKWNHNEYQDETKYRVRNENSERKCLRWN